MELLNIVQTQALMLDILTQDGVKDLNDPCQYRGDFLKLIQSLLLQLCLCALILPFWLQIFLSRLDFGVNDAM